MTADLFVWTHFQRFGLKFIGPRLGFAILSDPGLSALRWYLGECGRVRSTTSGTTSTTSTTTGTSTSSGSESTSTSTDAESAMAAVQEIFDNSCRCHLQGEGAGSLVLREEVSWDRLVGQKSSSDAMLVVAGGPDASYLLNKLLGTQDEVAGGNGDQMPKGRTLSASDIDVIEAWIADGALP